MYPGPGRTSGYIPNQIRCARCTQYVPIPEHLVIQHPTTHATLYTGCAACLTACLAKAAGISPAPPSVFDLALLQLAYAALTQPMRIEERAEIADQLEAVITRAGGKP